MLIGSGLGYRAAPIPPLSLGDPSLREKQASAAPARLP